MQQSPENVIFTRTSIYLPSIFETGYSNSKIFQEKILGKPIFLTQWHSHFSKAQLTEGFFFFATQRTEALIYPIPSILIFETTLEISYINQFWPGEQNHLVLASCLPTKSHTKDIRGVIHLNSSFICSRTPKKHWTCNSGNFVLFFFLMIFLKYWYSSSLHVYDIALKMCRNTLFLILVLSTALLLLWVLSL